MTSVKRTILITTAVFFILTVLFIILAAATGSSVWLTLAITFGTVLYHFAMRLFVGKIVKQNFNYKNNWFKEKKFEKKLYKFLKVKKWKDAMPSYNPATYKVSADTLSNVVNTMCRNEIIHEIIALLSFVPILFSDLFDAAIVFIVTSVIVSLFDFVFVIIQRYNRPRVIRLLQRYRQADDACNFD